MLNVSFKSPLRLGKGIVYIPRVSNILASTFVMNNVAFPIGAIGYQSFIRQSRELELTKRKHIRQSAFAYLLH